jgi:hypothetical protein
LVMTFTATIWLVIWHGASWSNLGLR